MNKLKCTISYDGAGFNGYQIQPGQRTVQGELEHALYRMHKKNPIRVMASGRTDTGVHAKGQVIHFISPLTMPEANWKRAMNTLLPDDIFVHQAEWVSDAFHSRYDAIGKEYRYFLYQDSETDVFKRHYALHYPRELSLTRIQEACSYLQGTHDFTTFSSAKASTKGSKVRTMHDVRCEKSGDNIVFIFYGDGFLYNMVRIMIGILLDVGTGKLTPLDILDLLYKRDRRLAGVTAPPQGLYLWRVFYA
ncbi:tRNA pseudouridine(38-40) synthase [Lentibacillus sp. JNUCC-1]|uniref:tRNA pseudouridine(38-40) synthase TruA n=1 Tax=Lentibacillus sp. JNUCC-1 TaxID=2654513 RepID=UPI0012E97A2F|nr:tRNA pseudouridine(38-40) synthase TruA [Lentibacillus sp. JNUCC-1]MUV38115.1 tRNA pseudouridine(38-40) synthase [Lentibacillus sp. JNUCC-1]